MALFRRAPRPEPVRLVDDPLEPGSDLAGARDSAVAHGQWEPAAQLLSDAVGRDWDRRAALAAALARAAVQPAPWLDDWLGRQPDDPGAQLVAGWTMVERAWDARGGGRAEQTGETAFAAFFRILRQARPLAQRAAVLAPDDPTPWVVLTWLSLGLQDGREVLDDHWAELTARDPVNRLGHVARLQCVSKKWAGSEEDMYAFAESVTQPSWAPVVRLQAHVEHLLEVRYQGAPDQVEDFWRRPGPAADLDAGHAWAVRDAPGQAYAFHDRTVVAYALSQAERWGPAAEVFRLLGPQALEYPWRYHDQGDRVYAKAYEQALRRG